MRLDGISPNARQEIERTFEEVRAVRGVQSVTAAYTATNRDSLVLADASGGAFTVTLYSAIGNEGRKIAVKRTNSGANAVTIDGNGSETIDGAATVSLGSQWSAKQLESDGSNWFVIGSV